MPENKKIKVVDQKKYVSAHVPAKKDNKNDMVCIVS